MVLNIIGGLDLLKCKSMVLNIIGGLDLLKCKKVVLSIIGGLDSLKCKSLLLNIITDKWRSRNHRFTLDKQMGIRARGFCQPI